MMLMLDRISLDFLFYSMIPDFAGKQNCQPIEQKLRRASSPVVGKRRR
jgi:hypothetical protein